MSGVDTATDSVALLKGNIGAWGTGYFNLVGGQVRCRRAEDDEFFYPYVTAEFVLFADTIDTYYTMGQWYAFEDNKSTGYAAYDIEMRHADKANCGFADSHVEGLGRTELNNLDFGDEYLWPPAQ